MHSSAQLPVHTGSDDRQSSRRHKARHYMQRVQESLTTRVSKLVCAVFIALLLIIVIITFILWLSLRPHRPRFYIRDLEIPGFAQTSGFQNAQVLFNVTARNPNQNIGIHYDALQVSLSYQGQIIGGTSTLVPFFQGPKNTTVLNGVVSDATLLGANQADLRQGGVIFQLQVRSTIRFKVSTLDSKHHKMNADCDVGVGSDGSILASYVDRRCSVYFT